MTYFRTAVVLTLFFIFVVLWWAFTTVPFVVSDERGDSLVVIGRNVPDKTAVKETKRCLVISCQTKNQTESLDLVLSDPQINAILHSFRHKDLWWLISPRINTDTENDKVWFQAKSLLPWLPGFITVAVRLEVDKLFFEEVYWGNLRLPDFIVIFLQKTSNKGVNQLLGNLNMTWRSLALDLGKIRFQVDVPKDSIKIEGDRIILFE